MKNELVATLLENIGQLLEMKGDNVFKIKAYDKAAENLRALAEDIEHLRQENRLEDVPGIGKAIKEKIEEYLDTGTIQTFEELIREIPLGVLEMMQVPSVGPKKAKLFWDELKVKNVEELHTALNEGRLENLPGIKSKTIDNIRKGLQMVKEGQQRMHIGTATALASYFFEQLESLACVKKIEVAGSLRRRLETVRDIDLLIESTDAASVMNVFVNLPVVKTIQAHGETKSSILTKDNVQVDLRVVESKCFGAALLYFTGSKNFNVKLRQLAIKKQMKVSEYGIFSVKDDHEKFLAGKTEEDVLKKLGLPFIPPELREDMGETELFSSKKIPVLVDLNDICGDLHVHSTWSDGKHSIEQMALAAQKKGYQYLAISDHSARLKVAGGVSVERLVDKKKEIEILNKKFKDFRILFGTEVEIDLEGNLDYEDKVLADFDVVVASIHSGFDQSQEKITKRLIKVCQNKHVDIIGHPTARHIGKRSPCDIDLKEFFKAAVDTQTILEINAFPIRLDLDSANVYLARSVGVKFAINTDAHQIDHLDCMKFGVGIARRGWLQKDNVVNTQPWAGLMRSLKR